MVEHLPADEDPGIGASAPPVDAAGASSTTQPPSPETSVISGIGAAASGEPPKDRADYEVGHGNTGSVVN